MLKITGIAFIIIFSFVSAFIQTLKTNNIQSKGNYFNEQQAFINKNSVFKVNQDFEFNAIAIKAKTDDFIDSYIILNNDTVIISKNEEYQPQDSFSLSNLIFASTLVNNFKIFSGNISGQITIYLINGLPDQSTKTKIEQEKNKIKSNKDQLAYCMEPGSINQSTWRAGLAPPNYDRV